MRAPFSMEKIMKKEGMKMREEIWNAIPGFDGYEASNLGRIRSSKRNWLGGKKRILSLLDNGNGYLFVRLFKDGAKQKVFVQELVLRAFVGERPARYQAAHVNGIRHDNRVGNLVWASVVENNRHKAFHNLYEDDGNRVPAFIGSEQLTRQIALLVGQGRLDPKKVKRDPVIVPDDKRLTAPYRNPQVA